MGNPVRYGVRAAALATGKHNKSFFIVPPRSPANCLRQTFGAGPSNYKVASVSYYGNV